MKPKDDGNASKTTTRRNVSTMNYEQDSHQGHTQHRDSSAKDKEDRSKDLFNTTKGSDLNTKQRNEAIEHVRAHATKHQSQRTIERNRQQESRQDKRQTKKEQHDRANERAPRTHTSTKQQQPKNVRQSRLTTQTKTKKITTERITRRTMPKHKHPQRTGPKRIT
jgi:hypothetical protein